MSPGGPWLQRRRGRRRAGGGGGSAAGGGGVAARGPGGQGRRRPRPGAPAVRARGAPFRMEWRRPRGTPPPPSRGGTLGAGSDPGRGRGKGGGARPDWGPLRAARRGPHPAPAPLPHPQENITAPFRSNLPPPLGTGPRPPAYPSGWRWSAPSSPTWPRPSPASRCPPPPSCPGRCSVPFDPRPWPPIAKRRGPVRIHPPPPRGGGGGGCSGSGIPCALSGPKGGPEAVGGWAVAGKVQDPWVSPQIVELRLLTEILKRGAGQGPAGLPMGQGPGPRGPLRPPCSAGWVSGLLLRGSGGSVPGR